MTAEPEPMPVAAILARAGGQDERAGGVPHSMVDKSRSVQDDVVVDRLTLPRSRLLGGSLPFTGDGSVGTLPGQIGRPDVGVDCGPRAPDALRAAGPRRVADAPGPAA